MTNKKGITISNKDFILLFDICEQTEVRWRMEGKIGYVQIGRKIYYTIREIERFMRSMTNKGVFSFTN